ncbi:unnamed protein product [Coccothraustes coccothraustes]
MQWGPPDDVPDREQSRDNFWGEKGSPSPYWQRPGTKRQRVPPYGTSAGPRGQLQVRTSGTDTAIHLSLPSARRHGPGRRWAPRDRYARGVAHHLPRKAPWSGSRPPRVQESHRQ